MTSSFIVKPFRAAAALLFAAAACLAQDDEPKRIPTPHLTVRGLETSKGALVMLINAKGKDCRESAVLRADDPNGAWKDTTEEKPLTGLPKNALRSASFRVYEVETGAHVDKGCWCEDPMAGLAVMAPARASSYVTSLLHYRRKDSDAFNRLCFGDLTVQMRPRREVPVVVWTPKERNMPSMAKDDIVNADWIFDKELAGVTLVPDFRELPPNDFPTCSPGAKQTECCLSMTKKTTFDASALNVYYGKGTRNMACDNAPVIFIYDTPILGDAAHEIGHSLGLDRADNDAKAKPKTKDTERYPTGHTTEHPDLFGADNVMWEDTHFLRHTLTPGQAFWLSHSCGSFLNFGNACAICDSSDDGPSPCPRFSTGLWDAPRFAVTPFTKRAPFPPVETGPKLLKAQTSVIHRLFDEVKPETCPTPSSTYVSGRAIEKALEERYDALNLHGKGRRDLQLGAIGKGEFKDHWEPYFAIPLEWIMLRGGELDGKTMSEAVPGYIRYRGKRDLQDLVGDFLVDEKLRKSTLPGCAK